MRCWLPGADDIDRAAIHQRFGFQQGAELSPACIGNRAGQLAVADHPRDAQILQHNRLVFTDELGAELVEEVLAGVGNAGMKPCHLQPCSITAIRSLLLARKVALQLA